MLQCYLQQFIGSKLFCEAVKVLQTAMEYLFLGFTKYLHVKLVIPMVRVINLRRLTVIIK